MGLLAISVVILIYLGLICILKEDITPQERRRLYQIEEENNMSVIKWETKTKGSVDTTQGDIKIHIKKKYKGANGYNIFIDGRDTGLFALTINDARKMAVEYTQYWV